MESLKKFGKFIYYLAAVVSCGALLLIVFLISAIIESVKKDRLIRASIKKIDRMDGRSFENYLAVLFTELGYRVEITKKSNDYGADLILKKGLKRVVVQAKRYSAAVSVSAIQEIYSAKTYYNISKAWVITNSTFTKQAKTLARTSNVKLIDRNGLIALGRKANQWR